MIFGKNCKLLEKTKKLENLQKNLKVFLQNSKKLVFPKEIVTFSKQKTLGEFCGRHFSHPRNTNNAQILVFPKENLDFLKNR